MSTPGTSTNRDNEPDLNSDLHACLDVIGRHFNRAKSEAANDGGELSELDCALGNVVQLVPLLLEDYEAAWDAVRIAREHIAKLEAETRGKVAGVLHKAGGLVVPR